MKKLQKLFRTALIDAEETQNSFAKKINVSPSYISEILSGKKKASRRVDEEIIALIKKHTKS